jgi:hypothetical protein
MLTLARMRGHLDHPARVSSPEDRKPPRYDQGFYGDLLAGLILPVPALRSSDGTSDPLAKPILPSAHEEYCISVTCTNPAMWWAA